MKYLFPIILVIQTFTYCSLAGAITTDFPFCTPSGGHCAFFSPDDRALEKVIAEMELARQKIRIATYNANVPEFAAVIQRKLDQGVRVEFMVDYKLSWESNSAWRDLKAPGRLERIRLPVMRGGNPQMHNKIIVIDDKVAMLGSANWTYSGLVGNYENVLKLTNQETIAKINSEIDELKANGIAACKAFADGDCYQGGNNWDQDFHVYLTEGRVPESKVRLDVESCKGLLEGKGILSAQNQWARKDISSCLTDKKWIDFFQDITERERYVSGELVSNTKFWDNNAQGSDPQLNLKERVYFAPEDDLERTLIRELDELLKEPKKSFAYISTNFITNPRLAEKVKELFNSGVNLKVFFDRGRFEDDNFKQALDILAPLGFTNGTQDGEHDLITVFNNQISGSYGANHNKMAVIYSPAKGPTVITGSANWSVSAMRKNDENLIIVEDAELAAIYAREILSELFVYRYGQNPMASGYVNDKRLLSDSIPCLSMLLGEQPSCQASSGETWTLTNRSYPILMVVKNAPVNPETESLWAWVSNIGEAIQLHTYHTFEGNWVSSIILPRAGEARFKLFKAPLNWSPEWGFSQVQWEYGGMDNDRVLQSHELAQERIHGPMFWGNP